MTPNHCYWMPEDMKFFSSYTDALIAAARIRHASGAHINLMRSGHYTVQPIGGKGVLKLYVFGNVRDIPPDEIAEALALAAGETA